MASDHRGNPLHAGKRTVQDEPNAVSGWTDAPADFNPGGYLTNIKIPTITEDLAIERGDEKTDRPMTGWVGQRPDGRWAASLNRKNIWSPYDSASLAENQLSHLNDMMDTPDMRDYRTEKRAKIAVEAMVNRRNEGRDYKTGRGPNFPEGTGRGKPY